MSAKSPRSDQPSSERERIPRRRNPLTAPPVIDSAEPITVTPLDTAATTEAAVLEPDTEPGSTGETSQANVEAHASTSSSMKHTFSTAAVIAGLCAIAFWGHTSHWTLPKFSALTGRAAAAADDWCSEHNVPESQCIECNPKLVPKEKDYGWCEKHGVGQCSLEHPEVVQLTNPPVATAADLSRAQRALNVMPRPANGRACRMRDKRVQVKSDEALSKAGIEFSVVEQGALTEALAANGEVEYDENAAAQISCRVPCTVVRVQRQVGDQVRQGDVLALVESPAAGQAKSEMLQALSQLRLKQAEVERVSTLASEGIVAGRRLREAQAELDAVQIHVAETQQALASFGLGYAPSAELGQSSDSHGAPSGSGAAATGLVDATGANTPLNNVFPIRAPLSGVVVQRNAAVGELIEPSATLFTVANVSHMALNLNVRQEDISYLRPGQTVLFRISNGSAAEPEHQGTIRWISTAVDPQTRTIKVRVELVNADGRLRAHTFGTARIVLRQETQATLVPAEAVHWEGDCHIVFVRNKDYLDKDAPKYFYVRQVRLGAREGNSQEIISGVMPGEVIAAVNSFVLQDQLLKSNLGSGCGCCNGEAK